MSAESKEGNLVTLRWEEKCMISTWSPLLAKGEDKVIITHSALHLEHFDPTLLRGGLGNIFITSGGGSLGSTIGI